MIFGNELLKGLLHRVGFLNLLVQSWGIKRGRSNDPFYFLSDITFVCFILAFDLFHEIQLWHENLREVWFFWVDEQLRLLVGYVLSQLWLIHFGVSCLSPLVLWDLVVSLESHWFSPVKVPFLLNIKRACLYIWICLLKFHLFGLRTYSMYL